MRQNHINPNIDEQSLITPALIERHNAANHRRPTDLDDLRQAEAELLLVLEMTLRSFSNGEAAGPVVERLISRLHVLRRKSKQEIWEQVASLARQHPVMEYLLQDPMTLWSFEKPRGYSGDAGLIDLIYRHESTKEWVAAATDLGRAIYAQTSEAPTCVAARERRDLLARLVDETAERTKAAEILAVACGHLREAELVKSLDEGTIKRWIAMDQDLTSIGIVKESQKDSSVIQAMPGSVAGLIRRSYKLGSFDLIYAAGLYDYLSRDVSVRLTQRLMEMVKPGGEFLFANFSDETATDGYMESAMNWPLILRGESEMWDIVNAAVDRDKVDVDLFQSENRYLYYVRLRKKVD